MGVIGGHMSCVAEYHFWQFGLGASHCIMKSSSSSSESELSLVVDNVEEELLFMSAMLKIIMINFKRLHLDRPSVLLSKSKIKTGTILIEHSVVVGVESEIYQRFM